MPAKLPSFAQSTNTYINAMTDKWTDRWNQRYSNPEFAYGKEPNSFLKEELEKLKPGTILFPAEGEGRNAVFAAKLGWTVHAFDISAEGQKKALQLAEKNGVTVNYQVGQLADLNYAEGSFDAIALIYAHFPAAIKSNMHHALSRLLRPGGTLIFEAFSKHHIYYQSINQKVGGPKDAPSLYSTDELRTDFAGFNITLLEEAEIILHEGRYHNGLGSVIRFVGEKQG